MEDFLQNSIYTTDLKVRHATFLIDVYVFELA